MSSKPACSRIKVAESRSTMDQTTSFKVRSDGCVFLSTIDSKFKGVTGLEFRIVDQSEPWTAVDVVGNNLCPEQWEADVTYVVIKAAAQLQSQQDQQNKPTWLVEFLDLLNRYELATSASGHEYLQLPDNEKELKMGSVLFGVFIRESYNTLWSIIEAKNSPKMITILGNPGVGKSYFGYFVMWKLMKEGVSFIYRSQKDKPERDVAYYCKPSGTASSKSYVVNELLEDGIMRSAEVKDAWFIADTNEPWVLYSQRCHKVLYLTSLKSHDEQKRYTRVLKHMGGERFFMPVWNLKELEECNQLCPQTDGPLPYDQIQKTFGVVGGIAMYCLERYGYTNGLVSVDTALLKSDPFKVLKNMVVNVNSIHNDVSQGVLHFNVDPMTCELKKERPFILASNHVMAKLCAKRHEEYSKYLDELVEFATRQTSCKDQNLNRHVGKMFEQQTLYYLASNKATYTIRQLTDPNDRSICDTSNFQKELRCLTEAQYIYNEEAVRQDDFEEQKVWEMPGDFPSVDALVTCPTPWFYQFTIALEHPIKASKELEMVIKLLLEKLKDRKTKEDDIKIDIIFVLPEKIYDSFQHQPIHVSIGNSSTEANITKLDSLRSQSGTLTKGLKSSKSEQSKDELNRKMQEVASKIKYFEARNKEAHERVDFVRKHTRQFALKMVKMA